VTPYGAAFVCVSWPLKEMGLFKKYGVLPVRNRFEIQI
jgi:hypothetical protein